MCCGNRRIAAFLTRDEEPGKEHLPVPLHVLGTPRGKKGLLQMQRNEHTGKRDR